VKKIALIAIFLSFFCFVNLAWGEIDLKEIKKLAESGDADAQFILGGMYYHGQGVQKNFQAAYVWWSIASATGDKTSKRNLQTLISKMTPQQIAQAQKEADELWKRINKSKK
jgi:TPR repeat protein